MSEEVLLISNLTAQCKWLLRAISDRLLVQNNLALGINAFISSCR